MENLLRSRHHDSWFCFSYLLPTPPSNPVRKTMFIPFLKEQRMVKPTAQGHKAS